MAEFHLPSNPNPISTETETETSREQFPFDEEYLHYLHYLASRTNHRIDTFGSYDEIFGPVLDNSSSVHRRFRSHTSIAAEELPVVELTAVELVERGLTVCAICTEELGGNERLAELPCRHFYHKDCILRWLTHRNTCPLCRHNVTNSENGCHRAAALS